jgi:alpha-1,2-mannosyltransferase
MLPMRSAIIDVLRRFPRTSLFVGLCGLYAATASYNTTSIDVLAAEAPAWALASHGTWDLSGLPLRDIPWYFQHDGHLYSDRFPGAILYLVPAYWIASKLGLSEFSLIPGALTAAVTTALAVTALHGVFRAVLGPGRRATAATLFVAVGTGAWSLTANAPWSHALDLLLISLGLLALSRGHLLAAGLAVGLSITSRPTLAVGIAVLGLGLGLFRRSPVPTVMIGLAALPGVALLFVYNGLLVGRWGPSNGHELGGEISLKTTDLPLNIAGALISPSVGLLFFYPILLLVLFTGRAAWRRAADWERAALLAGIAIALTQLALNRYSGGDTFFGPRLMIEPLAFAAPILARAVSLYLDRHSRPVGLAMLGVGVAVHASGAILLPY